MVVVWDMTGADECGETDEVMRRVADCCLTVYHEGRRIIALLDDKSHVIRSRGIIRV